MILKFHLAIAVAVSGIAMGTAQAAADRSPSDDAYRRLRERSEAAAKFFETPECRAKLKKVYELARLEAEKKSGVIVMTNPFVVCGLPPELR
jgi:hypothetical protein